MDTIDHTVAFYAQPGLHTQFDEVPAAVDRLPADDEAIIRFIKTLMLHPEEARRLGCRFNYKARLRALIDYQDINAVVRDPQILATLAAADVLPPCERALFSCDQHVLLFVSIARLQGRAARARCGYSTAIVPGRLTPHWIAEVFEPAGQQWHALDIEQQCVSGPGDFISGSAAWRAGRAGELDPARILDDYRTGFDGFKYRLLSDINALLQLECLACEWMIREAAPQPPDLFRRSCARLDERHHQQLDQLAHNALNGRVAGLWQTLALREAALRPGTWSTIDAVCRQAV